MKKFFATVVVLLFIASGMMNAQYKISGDVTDNTGKIIAFAQVFLHGTNYSTQSDENGHFELNDVDFGQYLLKASFIGHEDFEKSIYVDKDIVVSIVLNQMDIKLNDI